ncbi:MAG: hypothetical protein U9R44_00755 [Candidatus Omnitrophota bacterium]|nr:hypothetical protein [Candidatus Omnitrophota bacterium]
MIESVFPIRYSTTREVNIRLSDIQGINYRIVVTLFFIVLAAVMSTRLISGAIEFTIPVMIVASIVLIIATFVNTDIGLIAILLSMLLSPELEAGSAGGREVVIRAEDLLLVIVSFTWLAKMAVKKIAPLKSSPLNIPIGVYIAVLFLSTARGMIAGDVSVLKGMFFVLKLIEYYILFFMVLNQTTKVKQVKLFLVILLITGIIVGIYGNAHIGDVERMSAPFEGTGEPNTLGGYLLFVLSIVGGLIFSYRKRRWILLLIFLFLAPVFMLTLSRASYLGMFASLGAFVLVTRNKKVLGAVILVVILFMLTVAFGPPVIKDRVLGAFQSEESQELKKVGIVTLGPSPAARVVSYKLILNRYFPQKPILGWGMTAGTFVDSQYFLVLKETGLIGLFLFFWIMWRLWRATLDSYRKVETPLFKGLALGYLIGFAGLLFHAIGSNSFIIIRIAEPFWFFGAIMVKLSDIETGKAVMEEELQKFGGSEWRLQQSRS